jgi:hypothetical protein
MVGYSLLIAPPLTAAFSEKVLLVMVMLAPNARKVGDPTTIDKSAVF